MPVIRALLYVKTALHCALHNEFQKTQLLIVVSYWGLILLMRHVNIFH